MGNHYLQDALVTLEAEHAAAKARTDEVSVKRDLLTLEKRPTNTLPTQARADEVSVKRVPLSKET
jgi:hypothetical protein